MREIHSRKLLPTEAAACPFCGDHDLYINQEPSKDGTITWHTIHHGAPTPCSIRMLDIREDKLLERWNRRTRFDKPTSENIVEVALLFCEENNTVNTAEVVNTTSALLFIIERLYENGNISIPTRREREEERDNEAKRYLSGEPVEIEDGFGSVWSVVCPTCKNESMEVVRPGKVQCRVCQ